jgi:hypothetical protein
MEPASLGDASIPSISKIGNIAMKQIGAAMTLLMLAACGGSDSGSGSSTLSGASASQGLGASSVASGSTVGGATSTTGADTSAAGGTVPGTAAGTVTGTVPTGKMTLTTRVIDGPIQGALVCTDKNLNGVCDAGEPQATTDATGIASFLIDTADNSKYPVLAVVGLGAIDAVNGSVRTAYTLLAPADESDFITPLSTLVAQHVITTGLPTSFAVEAIQSLASVVTPLGDPSRFTAQDAALARLVVVTSQVLSTTLSPAVGQLALDGSIITNAAVSQIARSQLLRLLPSMVGAVQGLTASSEIDAAAARVVADSGLSAASAIALAGANNVQMTLAGKTPAYLPERTSNIADLRFTDLSNYVVRFLTATLAQSAPDVDNNVHLTDRKIASVAGSIANWGGTQTAGPLRSNDVFWNQSSWAQCPIDGIFTMGAGGLNGSFWYNACRFYEFGAGRAATVDIAGKSMATVMQQLSAAGYSNLAVANASLALGSAVFPANATVSLKTVAPIAKAIAYSPGTMNRVNEPASPCSSPAAGAVSKSLTSMIAAYPGTACSASGQDSFSYGGATYTDVGTAPNVPTASVLIGRIGSAPIGSGSAPAYYSGNSQIRVTFAGAASNAVSFLLCKERFSDGAPRDCSTIGTGSYSIDTLGDARVMSFNRLPSLTIPLSYNTILVERSGAVYAGYQSKIWVSQQATLNNAATAALATQLGIAVEDPDLPFVQSAGSYQGNYDLVANTGAITRLVFSTDGKASCADAVSIASPLIASSSCLFSITNPETGAFTLTDVNSGVATTIAGTIDYLSGALTAFSTPAGSSWSGSRQ